MTLFYYGTFATFAGLGAQLALLGNHTFAGLKERLALSLSLGWDRSSEPYPESERVRFPIRSAEAELLRLWPSATLSVYLRFGGTNRRVSQAAGFG